MQRVRAIPILLLVVAAACGGPKLGAAAVSPRAPAAGPAQTPAPTPPTPSPEAPSPLPGTRLTYELHMSFYSTEVGAAQVFDPQLFARTPGVSAGTGPQNIEHAAGLAPVTLAAPDDTPLYTATAQPAGITLGQWKAAGGESRVACEAGTESVQSTFTNLLTTGAYGLFVVHFNVTGPARFTPAGAGDSIRPSSAGTATQGSTFSPCLATGDGLVLVWNSSGPAHASPASLGITQHNQLIVRAPTG